MIKFMNLLRPGAIVAVSCLLLAAGCAANPHAAGGDHGPALEQAQAEFFAAVSARDPEATAARFATDAEMQVANMPPVRGREAIRAFYGNVFRFMVGAEYRVERLEYSAGGDLAVTTGSVTTVFEGREGRVEFPGKFFLAWVMRNGEWQVLVYGISNNRAP